MSRPDESRRSIRAAVVGVGHLGRAHARILAGLAGVDLVAVVDIDAQRADAVARATGARALSHVDDLDPSVEAVTVAVPTDVHVSVALPLAARGVAVLVEKPIAGSVAEADLLIDAARQAGAVLAVGHTERFNPAMSTARPLATSPRFIEGHRLGTFAGRSLDIDVVLDLMIHDLDLVLALVQSEVVAIEAVGVPVLTDRIDIANARLRFASGCIANLTASRISRERVRRLRLFQPDSYLAIDFAAQEVETWHLARADGLPPSLRGGKIEVSPREPLEAELSDFVSAVREGRSPGVSGADGRAALELAERINQAMGRAG